MRYNPTISVNDHHRGDNKHRIDAGYATYFDVPFIIQKINDVSDVLSCEAILTQKDKQNRS